MVVSTTFTFWVVVAKFPATSIAVQVIMVSPSGKTVGASLVTDITPTTSKVSGMVKVTGFSPGVWASTITSGIGVIRGGIVSTTEMVWVAIAIFPAPSIAVQMIVVTPKGNLAGALFVRDWIPLSSDAIACPTDTGVSPPVASINKSFGVVITGFVKSPGTGSTFGKDCVSCVVWDSEVLGSSSGISVTYGEPNFWILWPFESTTKTWPKASTSISLGILNWPFIIPMEPQIVRVAPSWLICKILL